MMGNKMQYIAVVLSLLLATGQLAEGKRTYGRSRGSSSGSSTRRVTSVTKPTYQQTSNSHADLAKFSYSGYNSQPNRPKASAPAQPAAAPAAAAPIGWNVPKAQGPPPSYTATNPVGGAKTNIHEPPPMYKQNNAAPPSYQSATNYQPASNYQPATNYRPANTGTSNTGYHAGTVYRPRSNTTGGFGSGVHTPIQASNTHGLQSGYPQQHMPAGATYYPSAGNLPSGATYYPSGVPHGSYAAPGNYPSPGGFPAGGSYYPGAGGVPAGATFYPAGHVPQGATFYSAPPPAVMQQGSSGPGLGTGLIAGALGGAILGHVLTPSGSSHSSAPVAAPAANSEDRIIIINNGPPGSVTTSDGTTVINAGGAPVAPAAAAPVAPAAAAPAGGVAPVAPVAAAGETPAPLAPFAPVAPAGETPAPLAPFAPGTFDNSNAQPGSAPALAPFAPGTENSNPAPPAGGEQPPAGGLICVPIMTNVTDPEDATKMKEVQQIACYPAPPPPAPDAAAAAPPVPQPAAVAEQPVQQQQNAEINAIPTQRTSTAELPENSKIQQASSGADSIFGMFTSSMFAFLIAYCIH